LTKVAILVTGDLERVALAPSLRAMFPDVEFTTHKVNSITSTTVGSPPSSRALREGAPAYELIRRLWKMVTVPVNQGERPADFAVAVDDVELFNLLPHGSPAAVVELVRKAPAAFLCEQFSDDRARTRHADTLRQQCSFHLLCPMVEAYFFGEPAALLRAGVPTSRAPQLRAGDLEDFTVNDPAFAAPTAPAWQQQRARRVSGGLNPDKHPKDYLDFLRDPTELTYSETTDGVRALETLAWPRIGASDTEVTLLRSLFEDLSDALGVVNPLGPGVTHSATWPARLVNRNALSLRNL
jgi:hypothetical protein